MTPVPIPGQWNFWSYTRASAFEQGERLATKRLQAVLWGVKPWGSLHGLVVAIVYVRERLWSSCWSQTSDVAVKMFAAKGLDTS